MSKIIKNNFINNSLKIQGLRLACGQPPKCSPGHPQTPVTAVVIPAILGTARQSSTSSLVPRSGTGQLAPVTRRAPHLPRTARKAPSHKREKIKKSLWVLQSPPQKKVRSSEIVQNEFLKSNKIR